MRDAREGVELRLCLRYANQNRLALSAGHGADLQQELSGSPVMIVVCEPHRDHDRPLPDALSERGHVVLVDVGRIHGPALNHGGILSGHSICLSEQRVEPDPLLASI